MITTKEIIHILENEEIPDEERDNLELLLQERAEELLKEYSKGKTVVIRIATGIDDLVDCIDLSEKMRETGSDNISELIDSLVHDKVSDLTGVSGWSEYEIEEQ